MSGGRRARLGMWFSSEDYSCLAGGYLRGDNAKLGYLARAVLASWRPRILTAAPPPHQRLHYPQRRTTALKEPQSISWSPRDAMHRGSLSQCALWSCPKMSFPNSVQDGRSLGSPSVRNILECGDTTNPVHIVVRSSDSREGVPDLRIDIVSISGMQIRGLLEKDNLGPSRNNVTTIR
jgi:hypothetical protein